MSFTHRQRLQAILDHKEADRVPIDFGAGGQTGMMASLVYQIKEAFGLLEPDERIKIIESYQMLGEVDEKMQEYFGFDVVGVHPLSNMFGYKSEKYKPWTLFDGTPVWVPELFNTEPDENGNIVMYAGGDKSYPPSCMMPKNGFYFDAIMRQKPFDENNLNFEDNTEEFGLLSEEEIAHFKKEVSWAYENTDKGIYMTFPGAGFGDIALVPGPFLKDPKGIRDISEWYMSLALRPEYIKEVFKVQSEYALENLKKLYKAVGNKVQVVFMSGADFGSQNGPMMSEATYRDIFLPVQKKLNDWVHENTTWKTFMHSCGSIDPLIPAIIEAGFDVLNPVQCSAVNMDAAMLKDKYGDKLTFWGGGIDTQKTIQFGTPAEVKAEVAERLKIFKQGGGYVFNGIHNLQAGVPVDNFKAMIEAYQENSEY